MSKIAENIAQVQVRIAAACATSGRDPSGVTLIAVSKTHPAEAVLEAAAAGVQHFGENRVEESSMKIPAVAAQGQSALTWHMIGHLQSRKAKDAAPLFGVIHSVDTPKLAGRLDAALQALERPPLDVLLEINVSGEASKAGIAAHGWEQDRAILMQVVADVRTITGLAQMRVCGLMTMAPIVTAMEETRPVFASLRRLRDALEQATGHPLPALSMGMTDDYPVAIEEGATFVRVGRAIFGERQP
ncbi:MAG: YggS family pyridoxal phosphate-dependent enzyme [bacterium]|nr:YggS family pyridoxal phosphate-dependent enzyme [bacterium]